MLHCSTLLLHVLLSWCSVAVVADPFYCDTDIIPGIEPLTSYFYHCDGLNQCIDRRDEAGCTNCPSGKLLLVGVTPNSAIFQYETVYELQDYKLRNKPVYKTTEDSLQQGYVAYNDLDSRWEVSQYADQGTLLVSSPTITTQPFLTEVTWRLAESEEILTSMNFQCVPENTRKCYGNVMIVSPKQVITLDVTEGFYNDRIRYGNEKYDLQYVLTSETWPTPHWQVVNKATSEEEMVFLRSTAQYPEFITTPGLYKSADSSWLKSSNLYVTCEVLTTAPDHQPHSLDCLFQSDSCGWSVRVPGDMELEEGAVEQFSVGQRAPPSLHITSDRGTPPGKYRLTSQRFDLETESCLLVKFANTVTAPENEATITISLKDYFSNEEVFSYSRCTNPNKQQCYRVDRYLTQMINLTLEEGTPKTNAQIVITIELHLSEQPSGVVVLVETALVQGLCQNGTTLEMLDPCYDMDFPCDSNQCVMAGFKGYQCQCEDGGMYGAHCEHAAEDTCSEEDVRIDHVLETVPLAGYRGADLLNVKCQQGYQLTGDFPRCQTNSKYNTIPQCVPLQCAPVNPPHSTTAVLSPSLTTVQCDEGFLPSSLQTLLCEGGRYNSSLSSCLLECTAEQTETDNNTDSPLITVDVSLCDYASGPLHNNYTRCKESSSQLEVPGILSVSTEISLSVDTLGKLCVSYANTTDRGLQCVVQCVESSVIQLVRTVDGEEQYVEVVTNFDYSREKLVNCCRDSRSFQLVIMLLGVYFILIS